VRAHVPLQGSMKIKNILIGIVLLCIAIGKNHLFLLLGMIIGVILIYFYVKRYYTKRDMPKKWKTISRDTQYVFGEIGREKAGFSREVFSADNEEK